MRVFDGNHPLVDCVQDAISLKEEQFFMVTRSMNNVDFFIGRRMRQFRWVRGISQADLAQSLGVGPEQIDAYETGAARVAAAQLFQIAEAMDLPVTAFFEGMDQSGEDERADSRKVLTPRESQMLAHFKRMSDRQQDTMLSMAQSMADQRHRVVKPMRASNVFWPEVAREG
ncbi:helix-turn-helix transcriptional regulator [Pseudotabrizicola sp. 4114]|uniref:helix-turn-helix domain-containing protein n=1 Tax=Pseudotabrizicola sp. 4114 TaxID=2817731 RepID=UPI0028600661|nr:transcriptional regulator with XRE-family HTH domain [Pseudorhodobacter sp. 4114]